MDQFGQHDQPTKTNIPDEGVLAENIMHFARLLRRAGMKVGTAAMIEAVGAIETGGISSRDDFYWMLHCVLANRHEDHPVFDEAFNLFWRSTGKLDNMLQGVSPLEKPIIQPKRPRAAHSRVSNSFFPQQTLKRQIDQREIEIDAYAATQMEILRKKDFAQMSAEELDLARNELSRLILPFKSNKTRRFVSENRKNIIDMRKTLSTSLRTGGDLLLPKYRKPAIRPPPIIILADISGSMSQYSRLFLHFCHALSKRRQVVHSFLFGTRLTNVSRQLNNKDPDQALQECSDTVKDWSGGTRIANAIGEFNRLWSRRVLGQRAVVLLISDGLERGSDEESDRYQLAPQMNRLHLSCQKLIWLNPLLRFDEFEARASGIRSMLPHVDEFRAVHSLHAISDICMALSNDGNARRDEKISPQYWLKSQ